MNSAANNPRPASRYLNVILTVNAALLTVVAVNGLTRSGGVPALESAAYAQGISVRNVNDPDEGGRVSAADQRKVMIAELNRIGTRIDRIEALMAKGMNVKVVELPAAFMKSMESRDRDNRKEPSKEAAPANPGANIDKK